MKNSAPTHLEIVLPMRVAGYVAFHVLGAGGMGRVFLASRASAHGTVEIVAIKQLGRDKPDDAQLRSRFVNEARIAQRLDHPNIVHTREVVAEPPEYFLVMEFLEGRSLYDLLRRAGRANVPLDAQVWILTEVLAALEYAHELTDLEIGPEGVVHRDVSPSNVQLCFDGRVKLLDFGIARAAGALAMSHQDLAGKAGYAAPEQCLGQPADPRSDVYAVGVMLWEAIAGRRYAPVETPTPDAPPALVEVLRRATARAPRQRQTAREFRCALGAYLAAQPHQLGRDDVIQLLERHFGPERAALARVIDLHEKGAPPLALAPVKAVEVLPASGPDEDDTAPIPVDETLLRMSRPDTFDSRLPSPTPVPPRERRKLATAVSGACVAASVAIGVAIASRSRVEPQATTAAATSAPDPSAPTSATAQLRTTRKQVALRISVVPENAEVRLDGRLLTRNPYVTEVEDDGQPHELRASADGHAAERRTLRFDADVDLKLVLPPAGGAAEKAPASRPVPVTPGSDPGAPPGSRRRGIDEKDPYAQ